MDFSFWHDMCPHQITVEPFVSVDTYGAYTYGSAVTHRARILGKNRIVTTIGGEEVVSHIQIYVGTATIGPRDRITLPAPFQPTQPNILDVQHVYDEGRHHHVVIFA